jgi:hypothetical protein
VRGPRRVVLGGGGREQDEDQHCDDASSAHVSRDGRDCNLPAINGCDQEERHCCVNPISPDAKGLRMGVVGTMPPYNDCCRHDNNDNNDDDDGLARYLATGAAPPPPTLSSLLLLLLIGKKNQGKKRGNRLC